MHIAEIRGNKDYNCVHHWSQAVIRESSRVGITLLKIRNVSLVPVHSTTVNATTPEKTSRLTL